MHCPYEADKAKLVIREMTDLLVLDLVDKGLVTDQMVLTVGYDIENLTDPARRAKYHGAVEKDPYGREIPKQAHGSINLDGHTSSTRKIMCAVSELFDRIVDKNLLVRRMYVVANHLLPEADAPKKMTVLSSLTSSLTMPPKRKSGKPKTLPWNGNERSRRRSRHQEEVRKERHPQGDES